MQLLEPPAGSVRVLYYPHSRWFYFNKQQIWTFSCKTCLFPVWWNNFLHQPRVCRICILSRYMSLCSPHHPAPFSGPLQHSAGSPPESNGHTQSLALLCRKDYWLSDHVTAVKERKCAHRGATDGHTEGSTYSCFEACLWRALSCAHCSSSSSCSLLATRISFCTSWFFWILVE